LARSSLVGNRGEIVSAVWRAGLEGGGLWVEGVEVVPVGVDADVDRPLGGEGLGRNAIILDAPS
jgi:hypothetical protein